MLHQMAGTEKLQLGRHWGRQRAGGEDARLEELSDRVDQMGAVSEKHSGKERVDKDGCGTEDQHVDASRQPRDVPARPLEESVDSLAPQPRQRHRGREPHRQPDAPEGHRPKQGRHLLWPTGPQPERPGQEGQKRDEQG